MKVFPGILGLRHSNVTSSPESSAGGSTIHRARSQYPCAVNADEETDGKARHELAVRTSVAVLAGGAGMLGPEVAAAATALTPALETLLSRVVGSLSQWRFPHAAETLEYGADAAGEPLEEFVEKAVADERREELLARTLTIAQDTALRDKRRALGRALAAGIGGDDAKIDVELLFIRAIADIDTPHIRLLSLMASERIPPGQESGSPFYGGWTVATLTARDPGLGDAIPVLLTTLQAHGLVRVVQGSAPWQGAVAASEVTFEGRTLLDRLTADGTA